MPNYLYPESADAWVRSQPALKALPKTIRVAVIPKLAKWARQQPENARPIHILPEGAADWAVKHHARGEPVDHFIASPLTRQQICSYGDFVSMLIAVSEDCSHPQLCRVAEKTLNRVISAQAGVPELLEKRQEWITQPDRRRVLEELGYLSSDELPETLNGQWWECEDRKQAYWVGEQLGNCLANGYYDEDFEDREQSGLRLFYLQDTDSARVLAVAAVREGRLEDFEAAGADREARQRTARRKHKDDLIDLLEALGFEVSPDDAELVRRTGICGRDNLSEFQSAKARGLRVWYQVANTLILHPPGCSFVIPIDIQPGSDSRYVVARDAALEGPIGANRLVSLRRQIDPAQLDPAQFDRVCRALSFLVRQGKLALDLSCFHEFAVDGTYWLDRQPGAIKMQIGYMVAHNGRAWWVPDFHRRLAYVFYDRNRLDAAYDPVLRERIVGLVALYYKRPSWFWNALADLRLPYPDLRRDAAGAPLLEPTIYRHRRRDAGTGWQLRKRCPVRGYEIRSRRVDDHLQRIKPTEQWICWHPEHGPVAGLLVRHVRPRKRRFDIQAPGQDPYALALLKQALDESGLVNTFSPYHSDHDLLLFGQPVEKLLLRADDQPLLPTTAIPGIGFSFRRTGPRITVFDAHKRVVLAARTDKENRLRRIATLGDPDPLRADFSALMAHLGVEVTDALQPLARQLGYRVVDGVLEGVRPLPEFKDQPVLLTGNEDRIDIRYSPHVAEFDDAEIDLPTVSISLHRSGVLTLNGVIEPDRDDEDIRLVREALCQAANYLGASLTLDTGRAFGLQRQPNGHYRLDDTNPPPPGWSFVGDGEQGWWRLDDDLGRPSVWYRDGSIGCAPEDIERFLAADEGIRAFLAWQDTERVEHTLVV